MKVALVYDRVNKWGGAERDLLTLHELFPDAPLYTSVYSPKDAPWAKVFPSVIPSFLQKIPLTKTNHEFLGAFTPIAFESFDFSAFDLVISVTSEAAKGIITKPGTVHICYCLTPTRYLWSAHDFYFRFPPSKFKTFPFFRGISRPLVSYLRNWDKIASARPDLMIAISSVVKKRIEKYYGRESEVIYPPVDIEKFKGKRNESDFYLLVGRLTPYKRVDLAVRAFTKLGLPLTIIGKGSEESRLKKMAKGNVKFIGELTDRELSHYYSKARALIFPQEEDFGKVVVEAHAAGTPVVAYKVGGAQDTILPGVNGVFFEKQSVVSLTEAIKKFEKMSFNRGKIVKSAERFSKDVFKKRLLKLINNING